MKWKLLAALKAVLISNTFPTPFFLAFDWFPNVFLLFQGAAHFFMQGPRVPHWPENETVMDSSFQYGSQCFIFLWFFAEPVSDHQRWRCQGKKKHFYANQTGRWGRGWIFWTSQIEIYEPFCSPFWMYSNRKCVGASVCNFSVNAFFFVFTPFSRLGIIMFLRCFVLFIIGNDGSSFFMTAGRAEPAAFFQQFNHLEIFPRLAKDKQNIPWWTCKISGTFPNF